MKESKRNELENLRKEMDIAFTSSYHIEKEVDKLDLQNEAKELLKHIEGFIVLTKKNNELRDSFNIYIKGAEIASGTNRICYMKIDENTIELKEYKGARGDRFSAYYLILEEVMKECGVRSQIDGNYLISDLEKIIQCINKVNSLNIKENFVLKETGKTYPRIYKGKSYQLPIFYFVKRNDQEIGGKKMQEDRMREISREFEELYKKCTAGTSEECFEICECLEEIKGWIDKMFEAKEIRAGWEKVTVHTSASRR